MTEIMRKSIREKRYGINEKRVKLLLNEGECLTVEFKEKYTSKIDEDIVAFANTKGGVILLGARDDRTIAGEQLTNDMKGRINSLARNCKPDIPVNAMQVCDVVIIEVPEGNEKPCYCGSGYFRRLNGNSQKMNHEEIRIMFSENEGILFFAKDVQKHISQAQMTLLAFKGIKKLHIFDRLDVRDDLLTQFNEAIFFIKKHLNVRSEIKGVNREDIYEIPIEALREAVVNAIMHRDYSIRGTSLTVEVYDDRVEITNPGGLAPGLSSDSFGRVSVRRERISFQLCRRAEKRSEKN